MERQTARSFLFASTLLILVSAASLAAKVPVNNPKNKATKGTTQLKGANDNPMFGYTYTLGKTAPINITVDGAEYTVDQLSIGNVTHTTNADEKLLVLHYTLHNPNPRDYQLSWGTLEIFGVDAQDQNWRYAATVGVEGTGEACQMTLKPGQKTRVYTFIKMPAKGALPKLVIQSRDRLVLRYDLTKKDAKGNLVNKVKPLPSPIADPADETGGTALETVPGEIGAYYPLKPLDAKLDSVAFSDAPISGRSPKSGQRYLVAIVTARNGSVSDMDFVWSTIGPKLFDQDGGEIGWNGTALYASRDENVRGKVAPGQELRVRYYFPVPTSLTLKSLTLQQTTTGRVYAYDLTHLK